MVPCKQKLYKSKGGGSLKHWKDLKGKEAMTVECMWGDYMYRFRSEGVGGLEGWGCAYNIMLQPTYQQHYILRA